MKNLRVFFIILCIASGCNQKQNDTKTDRMPVEADNGIGNGATSIETAFAKSIETAHNKADFTKYKALSFDFLLSFGGEQQMDATITMRTNSSQIKIENEDGSRIIYDGTNVYVAPANAKLPNARFAIFTWPYFVAMPFKLTDPGTQWTEMQQTKNDAYTRAKLTFDKNTGDTSEDWYIAFADNNTNLLSYVSYIVTFGKTIAQAEEEPHAIVYKNYSVIDGIPISDRWEFYNWTEEKGLFGDPIGMATLTNIQFTDNPDFTVPDDSQTIAPPN